MIPIEILRKKEFIELLSMLLENLLPTKKGEFTRYDAREATATDYSNLNALLRSYRQPTVPSNATVYVFYDAIPLATFLHIPLAGAKSTLNVLELLNTHKDSKWRIVMDFAAAKYYVFQ